MLKEEKRTVEKVIEKHTSVYDNIRCDLCKKKINSYLKNSEYGRFIEFGEFGCEENIPMIGMVLEDTIYEELRIQRGEVYDICKDCYENKIKPLLKKEFNIEPREVIYDK